MKPTIIILGPQGSGKSTQAEMLAKKFNFNYISTGNIIHNIINKGTKFGKKLFGYIGKGKLVPDKILIEKILLPEINSSKLTKGFVFEGVPRNLYQAHYLEKQFKDRKIPLPWLIYIDVSRKITFQRLATRKFCPNCGLSYKPSHSIYKTGKCGQCQGKLIQREDDQDKKSINKRLRIYYQQTKLVIAFYQQKKRTIKINGELSINQIHNKIISEIKKLR